LRPSFGLFGSWNVFTGCRQFNRKTAPFAGCATDGDASRVGLDNVFDDAQPDANALGAPSQLAAGTVKALEDFLVFRGGDAFAMVFDP
jgi:hypothetical protein